MSRLFRPRNVFIAGAAAALVFVVVPGPSKLPINPFRTPAAQNVADAYSRGGGSDTHLPAVATKRGSPAETASNQLTPTGAGTKHFEENRAAQKVGEPGAVAKAFNEAQLGQPKGK